MKYHPAPEGPKPEREDEKIFEESLRNPNVTEREYDNSRFGASHGSRGTDPEQGGPLHSFEATSIERTSVYDASGSPYGNEGVPQLEESIEVMREDQPRSGGRGRHPTTPAIYGSEENRASGLYEEDQRSVPASTIDATVK
jgi:hypothetical protein